MTRLKEADIQPIAGNLEEYDARLKRMTGASLRQIACKAAVIDEDRIAAVQDRARIAAAAAHVTVRQARAVGGAAAVQADLTWLAIILLIAFLPDGSLHSMSAAPWIGRGFFWMSYNLVFVSGFNSWCRISATSITDRTAPLSTMSRVVGFPLP